MTGSAVIKAMRGLLTGSLLLVLVHPASGQLISVQSLPERDSLMIGEQISYSLRVDASKEVEFTLPAIHDTLSRNLEVISLVGTDTLSSEDRIVVERQFLITGFESGSHIIPSQEVLYRRGESFDTARSMPVIINLYDPLVDTTQQIKAIKPPINTPLSFREVLPWAAVAAGGLFLAIWSSPQNVMSYVPVTGWLAASSNGIGICSGPGAYGGAPTGSGAVDNGVPRAGASPTGATFQWYL